MSLDAVLNARLLQREQANLIRQRKQLDGPQSVVTKVDGKQRLCFLSNDYLGLANHPLVKEAYIKAANHWGVGAGASHLVAGHQRPHHELEEALAAFTGRPRAVLFSSGYMANLGTINALVGKGDGVFLDRLAHASMLDGGRISQASFHRFNHNSGQDLSSQLATSDSEHKLIAVDGLYSMDGDTAPIGELSQVAQAHNAWLMVDDAHGFGVLGQNGRGTLEHHGVESTDEVPVLMATLSKALGGYGAFVAGSDALCEWLVQRARNYIFTTALPPAMASAMLQSLTLIQQEPERREHLNKLIRRFRVGALKLGLPLSDSDTAIQPIILGDEATTMSVAAKLAQEGVLVGAIRPPTVPQGTSRLRITLCAEHTVAHIDQLLERLAEHVPQQSLNIAV